MEQEKKKRGRKAQYAKVLLKDLNDFFNGEMIPEISTKYISLYRIIAFGDESKRIYTDKGYKASPDLNDLNKYFKGDSLIEVSNAFLSAYNTGLSLQKDVDNPNNGEYSLDIVKNESEDKEEAEEETASWSEDF
tara:strand:+ start:2939 stop:3340 length:402 start_codon:yes stop_codon:yes gene_type:complete